MIRADVADDAAAVGVGGAAATPAEAVDLVFAAERSRLLGIVYRMTGSYADAEDAVQDVWLRWRSAAETGVTIERPAAWLTTAVSRIALDRLRSTPATWR